MQNPSRSAGDEGKAKMRRMALNLFKRLQRDETLRQALIWGGASIGILTLVPNIFVHPKPSPIDFNYYWAAGRAWAEFSSPYSPYFTEIMNREGLLTYPGPARPFFYPPNTIAILAPIGALPYLTASKIWTLANIVLLAASSYLFALHAKQENILENRKLAFLLHLFLVGAFWNAGKYIFAYNLITLLIYSGFLLVLTGAGRQRNFSTTLGLIICLLKPQIGIPLVAACLIQKKNRQSAIQASAVTIILCLAGLAHGGFAEPLAGFLNNLSVYGQFPENSPVVTSSLGALAYRFLGVNIPLFAGLTLTIMAIIVVRISNPERVVTSHTALLHYAVLSGFFFLQSHHNMYLLLTPLAISLFKDWRPSSYAILFAFIIHARIWDLSFGLQAMNLGDYKQNASLLDSIAISISFIVFTKRALSLALGRICSR